MLANCSSLPPWRKLKDRHPFARYLAPVREMEWVVYAKPRFAGPQQVLDYVGRYTHRVAISNNRLQDIEAGQVRFQWKDYRDQGRQKTMMLSAEEFIRRFLSPRFAGWFPAHSLLRLAPAIATGKRSWRDAADLLGMAPPVEALVPQTTTGPA